MTEAEVRTKIERLCAAADDPVLTSVDVDDLVAAAKRVDAYGRAPSDTGWEPTWALWSAVVQGWERKAGKAAGSYRFSDQGATFDRGEVVEHCLRMAAQYARRTGGTIHPTSAAEVSPNQIANL